MRVRLNRLVQIPLCERDLHHAGHVNQDTYLCIANDLDHEIQENVIFMKYDSLSPR